MFLYFPHMAPHFANFYAPQQAPPKYRDRFPYIANPGRRLYAGMLYKNLLIFAWTIRWVDE